MGSCDNSKTYNRGTNKGSSQVLFNRYAHPAGPIVDSLLWEMGQGTWDMRYGTRDMGQSEDNTEKGKNNRHNRATFIPMARDHRVPIVVGAAQV